MSEELKILADDPGLPGGEDSYDPPHVEHGGKECEDAGYFISVCESGFVDPVLRHTIVEAAATLHDCEVCVTAAEVRAAVDAIQELLELTASTYSMSGGDQSNPGSEDYEDVTEWSEDSSNSDYSSASATLTCNSGGTISMSCGVGVRCASGSSSCSVRLVKQDAGETEFLAVAGTETTSTTDDTNTTVIGFNYSGEVEAGDQFKIQYKNAEASNPHTISGSDSFWDVSINSNNLGTFSGSTVSDGVGIKTAIQELETAVEAISGGGGGVGYEEYELFSVDAGNVIAGATQLELTVFTIPPLSIDEIRKRLRVFRNGTLMRLIDDVSAISAGQLTRIFSTTTTEIDLHSSAPLDDWDEIEAFWKD